MKETLFRILTRVTDEIELRLVDRRARRLPSRNLHNVLWERATQSSADFVEQHLSTSLVFPSKRQLWTYTCELLREKHTHGTCLEFGVAGGRSINFFSKKLPEFQFIGFDSFEGLKEDWIGHHARKGTYSQGGVLPAVNDNVKLVKGWFDDTVPHELKSYDAANIHFYHIDGDTYEAARSALNQVAPLFKNGDLVLFDELIGYPNWQRGEYMALTQAASEAEVNFRFRGFSSQQALLEIILD
jgi:hypothetical protein